ncbi:MAG TPA: hypothetical protein VFV72_05080 [Candidatus Limnocylindrales bacterium]|nr:hypothetical protein [Candidatus Limnocylindrales bacterium]
MSDAIRYGLALVVFAHGIGHVLFLVPALGIASWADQTGHSWLLSGIVGDGPTRAIAVLTWTSVIALFVAGVGGFLVGTDWWRAATIAAAAVSIVGIVVFWDGIATGSAVFALLADVVILGVLLLAHWPSTELAGL